MKHEHIGITSLEVVELICKMMRLYKEFQMSVSCQDGVWRVLVNAKID